MLARRGALPRALADGEPGAERSRPRSGERAFTEEHSDAGSSARARKLGPLARGSRYHPAVARSFSLDMAVKAVHLPVVPPVTAECAERSAGEETASAFVCQRAYDSLILAVRAVALRPVGFASERL